MVTSMKKIVIYHENAKLWDSGGKHNYECHRETAYGYKILFERFGYPAIVCDAYNWMDQKRVLELFDANDVYFTMGTNAAGVDTYLQDGRSLYEKYDVPHISLICDHFCMDRGGFFKDRLRNARCKNLILCLANGIDEANYLKYDDLNENVRNVFFTMPWLNDVKQDINMERDIEVLYTGRLYENKLPERTWNRGIIPARDTHILNEVADYMECRATSIYKAFSYILSVNNLQNSIKKFYPYFADVLEYIVRWRRLRLVDCLIENGIRLTMCDKSWEQYKYADEMDILGTKYYETMELYKRAKILVADLAGFNDYTHDRCLHAAKFGSAVICEKSTWMQENFFSCNAMIGFDWFELDKVPTMIKSMLNDDEKRLDMTVKANSILCKKFSRKKYVEKILETVNEHIS